LKERFFAKAKLSSFIRPGMTTPCLEWQAARDRDGYGYFGVRAGKVAKAHRLAWEFAHGPIPDGLHVLHKCDNPPCIDVEHLFLGTNDDNVADMNAKGRAVCKPSLGDANGSRLHPESRPRMGPDESRPVVSVPTGQTAV
jgi:hypothetical protein